LRGRGAHRAPQHAIVIGSVRHIEVRAGGEALFYGHGRYRAIALN